MTGMLESNKTKIAKRVVEVMEYFASGAKTATVMDIVRHYGRPQSSTSELLGALVEMGLLYKDPYSRSYRPTPRMAALGQAAQPEPIADGRLFNYMDRLAQASRLGVGLFGMVGTHLQVFRWTGSAEMKANALACGSSTLLSRSSIGLLLLSTLGLTQANKLLWRLNAEAAADERINLSLAGELVARCERTGTITGEAGLAPAFQATAIILPRVICDRPLALAAIYRQRPSIDADALVTSLRHGVAQIIGEAPDAAAPSRPSVLAI